MYVYMTVCILFMYKLVYIISLYCDMTFLLNNINKNCLFLDRLRIVKTFVSSIVNAMEIFTVFIQNE